MNTKFADLIVKKSADYNNEVVKALEGAGFILTLDTETTFDARYIVAKSDNSEEFSEEELEQLAEYSGRRFNDPLPKEYIDILNKYRVESEGQV